MPTFADMDPDIVYRISSDLPDDDLNELLHACWPDHTSQSYQAVLDRSLLCVTARQKERLIGFVNLAWDGGEHAFILDTSVHPECRRQGIGTKLVKMAISSAREHEIKWVHVDFEQHLAGFYSGCGFFDTNAGLIRLR